MTGRRIIILLLAALVAVPALADEVPVPRGYTEALTWYERAAEAGDPQAQFLWAAMLERGLRGEAPDPAAAADWYRKAAEQDLAKAQYRLGALYYEGRGVDPNPVRAARWFAAAAEGGVPQAQFDYALLLERGRGVQADATQAARWYERAFTGGIAQAALNLAALYARGAEGLDRDPVRALAWVKLAGARGLAAPPQFRHSLTAALSSDQRTEAGRLFRDKQAELRSGKP